MSAPRRLLFVALLLSAAGCPAHHEPRSHENPSLRPLVARLSKNPDDVDARLALAEGRRSAGDLEGALIEVYKALVSDPRSARAHAERARIYFDRGLIDKEIEAWRAALALDSHLADAHENLGHALVAAGRNTEAATEYRAALDEKPDALAALYNLALIETEAGHLAEARALWTQYVEKDPKGPWADRARAELSALAKRGER